MVKPANCADGLVTGVDYNFVVDCEIRMPELTTVINCSATAPPVDPPPFLAPCGTFDIGVDSAVVIVPPGPGFPSITGSSTVTTSRDCITCANTITLDLTLTLPKPASYVTYRLLSNLTPVTPCAEAAVLYDYSGLLPPNATVTVCLPRNTPTDEAFYPTGAHGIALANGDDTTFQVSTAEKFAMIVRARLSSSYGSSVMNCNTPVVRVTNLRPLHTRDDNFFPYTVDQTIPVSNQDELTGNPGDRVILFFDRALLSNPTVRPYFVASVHPPCSIAPSFASIASTYAQAPIASVVAVTSISPNPASFDKQAIAIDSWQQLGLTVYSVNTSTEINQLQDQFPGVQWIINDEPSDGFYTTPTQPINRLIDVSLDLNKPILLINSDIRIYGSQSRLLEAVALGQSLIGIRYNFASDPGDSIAEQWGLDAFLLYPDQVSSLARVPYAVGRPMWDYWLAWSLDRLPRAVDWVTEPYFFHMAHPVAWSDTDATLGHVYFAEHFEVVDWGLWRPSKPAG